MMNLLPELFVERLKKIIPSHNGELLEKTFSSSLPITVRVNTLKCGMARIVEILKEKNISFVTPPWCKDALILEGITSEQIGTMDFIREGHLYRQALSSMIPALVLDPHPNESVLDMCAAPGSKTTQMAALMQNQGNIVAIEAIRPRIYKLKFVIAQLGVTNVSVKLMDARRYRTDQLFDKILLDVPCSTEGRFKTDDPKSFAYWSLRKIKEMAHKQRGLLLSASRLLRPEGILVYSTCTFSPEENEAIIDWFLRKTSLPFEVLPIEFPQIKSYPPLLAWEEKSYDDRVKNCLRILPDGMMEGFFVVKLKRLG